MKFNWIQFALQLAQAAPQEIMLVKGFVDAVHGQHVDAGTIAQASTGLALGSLATASSAIAGAEAVPESPATSPAK